MKGIQIFEKPTTEKFPLAMAGRPAWHASTMTVMSSIITKAKPAMDKYSSCRSQHPILAHCVNTNVSAST